MKRTLQLGVFIAACGLVAVGIAACGSSKTSTTAGSSTTKSEGSSGGGTNVKEALAKTAWKLDATESTPQLGDAPITLTFHSDTSIGGKGPCNNYQGTASVANDQLTIKDVSATMMACKGDRMTNEATFHKALEGSHTATLNTAKTQLTLSGPGTTKLVFTASTTPADK